MLSALVGAQARADIIHVPADYPTIQEGIDAAVNGDKVAVANGTWTGVDNTNLDREATTGYVLTLQVGDGVNTSATETVSVSVLDANDTPPVVTPAQGFNVSEGAGNGTSVGTVYTYFDDRDELLATVFRDSASHELAAVRSATAAGTLMTLAGQKSTLWAVSL